jgi:cell division transport system permease protein
LKHYSRYHSTKKTARNTSRKPHNTLWTAVLIYLSHHYHAIRSTLAMFSTQPLSTLLTALMLGISLSLPGSLILLTDNLNRVINQWGNSAQISLFFKTTTPIQSVREIATQIRQQPGVAAVRQQSADESLAEFNQLSGFSQAMDLLKENPLPAVIIVTPHLSQAEQLITSMRQQFSHHPQIQMVQADSDWVQRLHALLAIGTQLSIVLSILLSLAVLLITGNVIRIHIESRRQEIEVAFFIGAAPSFVQRPFLYAGFFYGLLAGLTTWGIMSYTLWQMKTPISAFANLYGQTFSLSWSTAQQGQLIFSGIALGWLGSWLAMHIYLYRLQTKQTVGTQL